MNDSGNHAAPPRSVVSERSAAEPSLDAAGLRAASDEELVRRFLGGQRGAFEVLVKRHQDRVFGLCVRLLGIASLAEEAAQDIFVRVYRSLDSFRGDSRFSTWLYRVTLNHCRNVHAYRARRMEQRHDSLDAETEDEEGNRLAGAEEREAVSRYGAEQEAEERREEIQRYSARLTEFGIRFTDLVVDSPRHADARVRAIECARVLAGDPLLAEHLRSKRELPLKALENRVGVSRKTLERQRRYIIAVAVILLEEVTHLRHYISLGSTGTDMAGRPVQVTGP